MDITTLVKLTSRAWSLNILALMHEGLPGRQAPLLAATSASRTAFGSSLKHLIQLGLLERNPGHGHPLRPEFRLTSSGVTAAKIASGIVGAVPDDDAFVLLRRNWPVPILALTARPRRFSALKSQLAVITDRALSHSLQQLEDRQWVQRDIQVSDRRPHPVYRAVNTGLQINQAIGLVASR